MYNMGVVTKRTKAAEGMPRRPQCGEGSADPARALFQALLDHWWECRRRCFPREPKLAPAGYLISYVALIQRAGVVAEARRLGGPLTEIGELCKLKGWPPMAALVVRQDAGHPGIGYFRRADAPKIDLVTDGHLREWEQQARECIEFAKMPRNAPALKVRQKSTNKKST